VAAVLVADDLGGEGRERRPGVFFIYMEHEERRYVCNVVPVA
jgi:hypothetical protein